MKNNRFLFFLGGLLLLLALLPLMRIRPPALPWTSDPESAFSRADREGVAVVAYLYTDWCGYCRQMDSTTFQDPDLIKGLSDRFTWLRLNPEKDPVGRRLQRKFGINGFPTVLILDSKGDELDRIQGFIPASRFRASLEVLLQSGSI